MLESLKSSPEKRELVDAAMKYLRGVKGTLVQQKKRDREKAMAAAGMMPQVPGTVYTAPPQQGSATYHGPPGREVPQAYQGPTYGQPANGQHHPQAAPRQQQWSQQAPHDSNNGALDEHAVESALRGYLGG
jgi:hypothetical protein